MMNSQPPSNQQLIDGMYSIIPTFNKIIIEGYNEFYYYNETLRDESYEEQPNETEDDAIKRAESIYDRLDEVIKRNDLSTKKAIEAIEILKRMTNLFEGILKNNGVYKEVLAVKNNETIDKIIDLEQRKTNKLIEQYPTKKGMHKGILDDKKDEWDRLRVFTEEMQRKKIEQERNSFQRDVNPLNFLFNQNQPIFASQSQLSLGALGTTIPNNISIQKSPFHIQSQVPQILNVSSIPLYPATLQAQENPMTIPLVNQKSNIQQQQPQYSYVAKIQHW